MSEPELQPNDLEERIKTQLNRYNIAFLLYQQGKMDWLPTILEDAFCGGQYILDYYCVVKNEQADSNP